MEESIDIIFDEIEDIVEIRQLVERPHSLPQVIHLAYTNFCVKQEILEEVFDNGAGNQKLEDVAKL